MLFRWNYECAMWRTIFEYWYFSVQMIVYTRNVFSVGCSHFILPFVYFTFFSFTRMPTDIDIMRIIIIDSELVVIGFLYTHNRQINTHKGNNEIIMFSIFTPGSFSPRVGISFISIWHLSISIAFSNMIKWYLLLVIFRFDS